MEEPRPTNTGHSQLVELCAHCKSRCFAPEEEPMNFIRRARDDAKDTDFSTRVKVEKGKYCSVCLGMLQCVNELAERVANDLKQSVNVRIRFTSRERCIWSYERQLFDSLEIEQGHVILGPFCLDITIPVACMVRDAVAVAYSQLNSEW